MPVNKTATLNVSDDIIFCSLEREGVPVYHTYAQEDFGNGNDLMKLIDSPPSPMALNASHFLNVETPILAFKRTQIIVLRKVLKEGLMLWD
jgi:hypothetical protein